MKVTRKKIISLHVKITKAFIQSKTPGAVELKRFEDDGTLYLDFCASTLNHTSRYIYEGRTEEEEADFITQNIINFLQGKQKVI